MNSWIGFNQQPGVSCIDYICLVSDVNARGICAKKQRSFMKLLFCPKTSPSSFCKGKVEQNWIVLVISRPLFSIFLGGVYFPCQGIVLCSHIRFRMFCRLPLGHAVYPNEGFYYCRICQRNSQVPNLCKVYVRPRQENLRISPKLCTQKWRGSFIFGAHSWAVGPLTAMSGASEEAFVVWTMPSGKTSWSEPPFGGDLGGLTE